MQPTPKMSGTECPLANFQQATNAVEEFQLIPRPAVSKHFFRTNHSLAEAMKATHPTAEAFKDFKKLVQRSSKEILHRNHNIRPNSREWSGFVEQLLLHDSKLANYEDLWPVEYYVHTLGSNWKRQAMLSSSGFPLAASSKALVAWTRQLSPPVDPTILFPATQPARTLASWLNRAKRFSTSERDLLSAVPLPRTSQFSQSAPATMQVRRQGPTVSFSQTSQFLTSRHSEQTLSPTSSTRSSPRGTRFSPYTMPEQRVSRSPSVTTFIPGASHSSPAPPIISFYQNPILASCLLCRPPTTAQASRHPSWTKKISAFAETDDDVLRALALLGVVFDQHLDIILVMDSSIFEELVRASSAKLKASMKYRLLFLLEQAKEKRDPSNQMPSLDSSETTHLDITQVPCRLHPLVDISAMASNLQSLLRTFGIGELVPAFALMGLLTLEDFKHFCNLSESARTTMITNLRIQLNHFQNFMLNRAFRANAIESFV